MNCQQVCDQLSSYFDGELEAGSQAEMQQHFRQCNSCSDELASYQALRELLQLSVSKASLVALPSWESIAARLDQTDEAAPQLASSMANHWKAAAGIVCAIAASVVFFASLRGTLQHDAASHNHSTLKQAGAATMNLQPVLALFAQSPELAVALLTDKFATKSLSITELDSSFGRPTLVGSLAGSGSLPSNAKVVSSQLLSFPFCSCPEGACNCGPNGCNCAASVCQRPDGSRFLVLEHCKSQDVSFGDLPTQLVSRGDLHLQQATSHGTQAVSWERETGCMTVIGLRDVAEIGTLLASN
ncbi:MAG: zf-HC2 domain-containing protein [Pirellulaceae bacterium]|jgi:hypothetical protein